jgi:hypothetical protein
VNVVFIIFRRPDTTARVFRAIAHARPQRLFVVADGPRNAADEIACSETREIVRNVNWPCEVVHDYADRNMGCGRRVASGLDRVFERVDEAIVVEDDCLPEPSFFPFCQEVLERFRGDVRVGHIAGSNLTGTSRPDASYLFSRYLPIWGWATWRRAWEQYDFGMKKWPGLRARGWHRKAFRTRREGVYFEWWWNRIHDGVDDTWDGQWLFAQRLQEAVSVIPCVNLVSNIGFGPGARCTTAGDHPFAALGTQPMEFPLRHPGCIEADAEHDAVFSRQFTIPKGGRPAVAARVWSRLRNLHWYGGILRRIPLAGAAWAGLRDARNAQTRGQDGVRSKGPARHG